jgi:hypothetical protein
MKAGALPVWGLLYVAGDIVLSAWMLRAGFRARGRIALLAGVELLGGVCMSIPAMSYMDSDFAAAMNDTALRILFCVGLVALLWYGRRDLRTNLRDPVYADLPPRQRWLFFLMGPGMMLAAGLLELWWASMGVLHAG